jgi:hypothetical protein
MVREVLDLNATDARAVDRNIGRRPVRPADMLSAARVASGYKPAGHTDWKSMFRIAPYFQRLLGVNEQVDFFRQQIGNFAYQISAQDIDESVASRRAKNQT